MSHRAFGRQIAKALLAAGMLIVSAMANAYPIELIKVVCVPELDFFEISISNASDNGRIYVPIADSDHYRLRPSVADSLRKKNILVLLEPGKLRCSLKDLEILLSNDPYSVSDNAPLPGSRLTLSINGHAYASAVDVATEGYRVTRMVIDGADSHPGHALLIYTARKSASDPEFLLVQQFPDTSTVTNATLATFDGVHTVYVGGAAEHP